MSIVPAGKRKPQIAQGPLRNESILDSILFKKIGQGAASLINDPVTDTDQDQGPGRGQGFQQPGMGGMPPGMEPIQDVMNSGGLADPHDHGRYPGQEQGQGNQGRLSPFLQISPQESDHQESPLMNQLTQIENMLQGEGFGIDFSEKGNGKYVVQLMPMEGAMMSKDNYRKILHGLTQLGFNATGVKLPANDPSNEPVYMEYTLGGGSQKVMKSGKNR